ncbi:hypothetical protein [Blastococcus sp. SYSU DS0617]
MPAVVILNDPEPPRRWSWSMYVESSTDYRYEGATADDASVPLDPDDVGEPWNDIHYGPDTLEKLCAANAELESVNRYYDDELESEQRC